MADTSSSRARFLVQSWHQQACWLYLLWPISLLYRGVVALRWFCFRRRLLTSWKAPVPVIVVGNISVGGTGKTPLVAALVNALQAAGLQPGIVSRGYTSQAPVYPFLVTAQSSVKQAGDEPLLLAIRTGVPVMIGANRVQAVQALLHNHPCDVVVCDDGLQHYALQRDIELIVIDGQRLFGNGWCLPAGPLREPLSRIQRCDFVVGNGELSRPLAAAVDTFTMQLKPVGFKRVGKAADEPAIDLSQWSDSMQVHAVAGIGNPGRFFDDLRAMGFSVIEHEFDDHHLYCASDLLFSDKLPVIMTEKDAVKVRPLHQQLDLERCWYVPVNAVVDNHLLAAITERTQALLNQ